MTSFHLLFLGFFQQLLLCCSVVVHCCPFTPSFVGCSLSLSFQLATTFFSISTLLTVGDCPQHFQFDLYVFFSILQGMYAFMYEFKLTLTLPEATLTVNYRVTPPISHHLQVLPPSFHLSVSFFMSLSLFTSPSSGFQSPTPITAHCFPFTFDMIGNNLILTEGSVCVRESVHLRVCVSEHFEQEGSS